MAKREGGLLLLALGIVGLVVCRSAASAPAKPTPTPVPTPTAPAAPAGAAFQRLVGRWLRPDGGYILEIRSVSSEGKVDASYLNPRSIRVARAEAFLEAGRVTLFIELRDVNYPGSTYRLVHDGGRDVLEGVYFQALQQQTFDVAFVRR